MQSTHLLAVYTLCFIKAVVSFNLDTATMQNYQSDAGSYFGFSTALHKESSNTWILVGAPLSSRTGAEQGATFKCNTSPSSSTCEKLPVDEEAVTAAENKTTQWLGATVFSTGPGMPAVTCAPRYMDIILSGHWLHGRCFVLEPNLSVRGKWNPCLARRQGNVQYGYCQAGLAAYLTNAPKTFLITDLLGLGQARGAIAVIDASLQSDVYAETASNGLTQNDYMGYAITWGNFSGTQFGDAVGGAPRGNDLQGEVIIYTLGSSLPISASIANPDEQIGSYFGGSLGAVDLNNDGWSDLLVGAPFYSTVQEEGQVYVYLNNGKGSLNLMSLRLQPDSNPNARFGTSIASIGDVNLDNYPDVAIGAPYGGTDGNGAVYIYYGSAEGFANNFQPVQVITSSALPGSLKSFGSSISNGLDIDGNGYPDIAVGSYQSSSVQLFRASKVINVFAEIYLNTTSVSIDLDKEFCLGADNVKYGCVAAEVRLRYNGQGAPASLNVGFTIDFDSQVAGERRAFLIAQDETHSHTASKNLSLTLNQETTTPYIVYILTTTKDLLSSIRLSATYALNNPASGCGNEPCPVLNFFSTKVFSNQISYLRNCGADNFCRSDLSLSGTLSLPSGSQEYVYGQDDSLTLNILATNLGENAFLSAMEVFFPNDIDAIGVEFVNGTNPFWDKQELNRTHDKLVFDLPTPFAFNRQLTILVKMAPKTTRPSSNELSFLVSAATQSTDVDLSNNNITLSISTGMLTCLHITGSVSPQQVFYNDNSTYTGVVTKEDQIGEQVDFTFLIKNQGPSQISEVDVNVKMTTKKDNNHILYLLSATIDGTIACNVKVDPLNLTATVNSSTGTSNRKRRAIETLDCSKASCTNFRCKIGQLTKGQGATLRIRGRIWEQTFNKMGKDTFNLTTFYQLVISDSDASLLRIPAGCKDGRIEQKAFVSVISQQQSSKSETKSVDWWIILLAILGGLILIAAGVALLYKAGFFKRNIRAKYISSPADNAGIDE